MRFSALPEKRFPRIIFMPILWRFRLCLKQPEHDWGWLLNKEQRALGDGTCVSSKNSSRARPGELAELRAASPGLAHAFKVYNGAVSSATNVKIMAPSIAGRDRMPANTQHRF
jgi:hypothetical protein